MSSFYGNGNFLKQEDIDGIIAEYLNTHDADIVTEAELGQALAEKQNVLNFDETPQPGSTNPITSNGVYTAIEGVSAVYVSSSQPAATAAGNDIWLILRDL